jgi:hypothetical protein
VIARELEQILFEELGYAGSPGLLPGPDIAWPNNKAIPGINAALFLKNIPIAYFSRLADLNLEQIYELHRNVWSQSKAPLLFVTLPHEIRIYSGYARPPLADEELDTSARLLQQLTNLTDHLQARHAIQQHLIEANHYERIYLETGAFWNTPEGRRIDYQTRADKELVASMARMRRLLTAQNLSNHLAYTLLGRSVFIRYLEDRGILTADWATAMTQGKANSYRKALGHGRQTTYRLFEALNRRFNGDLFPVEEGETAVTERHIEILLAFLSGANLDTGQLSFWPYNFEYIPIELISHIYDTFIDEQRASGAYYTPLLLADFILEETLGNENIEPGMRVLDPACGSGIFLVGAYRRLALAWRRRHGDPTPEDLSRLLQTGVYGVDKNREAVRIATFSLYLEVLNQLSNEQVQNEDFRFPPLIGRNLLVSDFFAPEVDAHFAGHSFDRVVGNLPWGKGTLTTDAQQWLVANNHVVGGRQAAPAFLLRVPQFCKESGEAALLAPAKSTIFITSGPHRAFRDTFFTNHHVRAVVNFTGLVYELFPGAKSPVVALFYNGDQPPTDDQLLYATPKPSPLSQRLKAIVLDTTEIKFLNRWKLLGQPYLWKVAQWGTPRDAALISRLRSIPTLRDQAEKMDWTVGEGIQIGGGDENPASWLQEMPIVRTEQFQPYFLNKAAVEKITASCFHRPRIPELTMAPLVLIHQSACSAAFSSTDIAYHHTISGVSGKIGQEQLLYWLVAYLNSPLAKYYHFLTSTRWAVERGNIIQWEYEEMPFLVPDKTDPRLGQVLQNLERIQDLLEAQNTFYSAENEAHLLRHERAIHQLVYELYGLHPVEQQLVEDMLAHGVAFFEWAKRGTRRPATAAPVQPPDVTMLTTYAEVFRQVATSLLRLKGRTLNAIIYQNGAPLTVVSFYLADLEHAEPIQVITQPEAMRARLRQLDQLALNQQTPSLYIRRHARIYDGNEFSLIRPSEKRFWTQSQARTDADAFLAELHDD